MSGREMESKEIESKNIQTSHEFTLYISTSDNYKLFKMFPFNNCVNNILQKLSWFSLTFREDLMNFKNLNFLLELTRKSTLSS